MVAENYSSSKSWLRSPRGLILVCFFAIAAFFLLTEHRAHLFGILPYLLLLACPLLHWLMHGGHGGHGDENGEHKPRS